MIAFIKFVVKSVSLGLQTLFMARVTTGMIQIAPYLFDVSLKDDL